MATPCHTIIQFHTQGRSSSKSNSLHIKIYRIQWRSWHPTNCSILQNSQHDIIIYTTVLTYCAAVPIELPNPISNHNNPKPEKNELEIGTLVTPELMLCPGERSHYFWFFDVFQFSSWEFVRDKRAVKQTNGHRVAYCGLLGRLQHYMSLQK